MTGFAQVRRTLPEGELSVSLKSLNHRGLELRFHTGGEFDRFENAMRVLLTRALIRGHVDVRVSLARKESPSLSINRPLLQAYLDASRTAREQFGLVGEPDLASAFRIPGMLMEAGLEELGPAFEQRLLEAVTEAIAALNAFREREGTQLAADLRALVANIVRCASRIAELREQAAPLFQARLLDRLSELLGNAAIDRQRLAQEAAFLVDRSDIREELSRLKIHASQLEQMLADGGEIGKRMDFLLQEMNRETNTTLSKTNAVGELGLEITSLALAVKGDVEKIREQALNLE
ncbi:MAG: YicC family protein [Bryobacteraceae bacterium]|nr:YicC family protein [Bryobacteraceae bacterium]